jgi:hypothetical protein
VREQQKSGKKFEFAQFKRRHILLKVCYFGWDYMGFATQVTKKAFPQLSFSI